MTRNFKETRELAKVALNAKRGKVSVDALGRRAMVMYQHLTTSELEELASIGIPAGR